MFVQHSSDGDFKKRRRNIFYEKGVQFNIHKLENIFNEWSCYEIARESTLNARLRFLREITLFFFSSESGSYPETTELFRSQNSHLGSAASDEM
mmetsp:Transcript_1408/g.3730  ORF Transcript_1408/g.3730 Transcript_1408/m.3730 type:complete len:94 (+) Transcript_1408:318-599(+)